MSQVPSHDAVAERIRLAIGSALFLGLAPIAPGSFGALLGVAYHLAVATILPRSMLVPALGIGLVATLAASIQLTEWAQRRWQSSDPSHFVLDEVAGYLLVPILFHRAQLWQIALWGFLLFRVFDVIKIPPARQIDRRMHGAIGIVLDDLVSAVYAALALYALAWLSPKLGLERWLINSPLK